MASLLLSARRAGATGGGVVRPRGSSGQETRVWQRLPRSVIDFVLDGGEVEGVADLVLQQQVHTLVGEVPGLLD